MTAPALLPENAGLAFLGEPAWLPSILPARLAQLLAAAPNACGRPNADVLRRRLAVVAGEPVESWQIDFPNHFTAQEAELYEQPFSRLPRGSWQNPHANPALRRAIARVSRYLAMPAEVAFPDWKWIEEDLIPDASLVIVARDDDFTHGIIASQLFALWSHTYCNRLEPVSTVESFPFPWPPGTALSSLTAAQEEYRHAIARAARSADTERLNSAVLAAYGWPVDLSPDDLLVRLHEKHQRRIL